MTQKNNIKIISVVHPVCCGLDVHKNMVSACIIITESDGENHLLSKNFLRLQQTFQTACGWRACYVLAS